MKYAYSYGEPSSITDVTDSPITLWMLNSANDYSAATSETYGTSVGVTSGYKAWTNELASRQAGVLPATANRQNLAYQWDTVGNLTQRQDLNQALTEVFTMDPLDRVSSSTLNGQPNFSAGYDASGNISAPLRCGHPHVRELVPPARGDVGRHATPTPTTPTATRSRATVPRRPGPRSTCRCSCPSRSAARRT